MAMSERSLKRLLETWHAAVRGTHLPQPPQYSGPDVLITRLTEKTSEVGPGACFVARVRETSDGHPYIGKAIAGGAGMILAQRSRSSLDLIIPENVVYLQVSDTALTLAWLAAAWHDFPSNDLVMIGVTGTDGKTSTGDILFSILRTSGHKVGLLSTIKAVIGEEEEPLALHVTTPEAKEVQRQLRRMVDAGLTHCVVETTSHGLAQHRVSAIDFDIAIVTNITHEHLDYHGDYQSYIAAKARLFETLSLDDLRLESSNKHKKLAAKTAVLNRDDGSYHQLAVIPVARRLTYGLHSGGNVRASDIDYSMNETRFTLLFDEIDTSVVSGSVIISSTLAGEFNVYNMLAAATAALSLGLGAEEVQNGLQSVRAISGRMERIDHGQPFLVLIDFAHTPNALEKAIQAARQMTEGRIITVFGSAGKRDVEKRRLMAEASARLADLTVLTAEDPRTESLDDILAMMVAGCRSAGGKEGETFWRVPDRGQAIHFALNLAQAHDTVLICGKGHEQSMCFGIIEYPWDDRNATRIALDAFLQGQPMSDLGLPTFQLS
jgi:UDP-N-acetylmuramoyl-L-alanyl-D-glutamate--2,6-diaminopimelate ligase